MIGSSSTKIIKEFEQLPYNGYVRKRPKLEPTDSYFYIARQLDKCMMRSDALNLHVDPVITEMTSMQHILISHVYDSDQSKSKEIPADKTLSPYCSTDKSESEIIIVDESYTEESESESAHKRINTNEEKYAMDEIEHE